MHTKNLIDKILVAKKLEDLIDPGRLKVEFTKLLKKVHPDVCKDPRAHDAFSHLQQLKDVHVNGQEYVDDNGTYTTNGRSINFVGDPAYLKKSYDNYQLLKSKTSKADLHFHRYLPESMLLHTDKLEVRLAERAIPLSGLSLPQEHSNWVLSRILEFVGWLSQSGYVHVGINPESIFVVPETHGIIVTSFYHMTALHQRLQTVSGKYRHWYTPSIFDTKQAVPLIDLELAKKTAIYLLGDHSGSGIKLRKTHNKDFINFVIAQDTDPYECYDKYRKVLDKNFPRKFYPLNI